MGSDLYACVEYQARTCAWWPIMEGPSTSLARGPIVDCFGDCDPDSPIGQADGYLNHVEWTRRKDHPECPWRNFDPYWVRCIPGEEFVRIVREEPWRAEWPDQKPSPDLRAFAAMVESYLKDGVNVRVWCWHSQ